MKLNTDGNKLSNIQSNNLTNISINKPNIGIKLGVGGLTKAFSTAAKTVIEEKENKIIEKQICDTYKINFSYSNLKELEIFCIQNKFEIIEKNFDENCKYQIEIPILKSKIIEDFLKLNEIKFQK